MITINGVPVPSYFMNRDEMLRSLKIGSAYLEKLEEQGLPYIPVEGIRLYDPNKVWKWWEENGRKR